MGIRRHVVPTTVRTAVLMVVAAAALSCDEDCKSGYVKASDGYCVPVEEAGDTDVEGDADTDSDSDSDSDADSDADVDTCQFNAPGICGTITGTLPSDQFGIMAWEAGAEDDDVPYAIEIDCTRETITTLPFSYAMNKHDVLGSSSFSPGTYEVLLLVDSDGDGALTLEDTPHLPTSGVSTITVGNTAATGVDFAL